MLANEVVNSFLGFTYQLATGFSLMLLVDKKLAPSQAVIQSLKCSINIGCHVNHFLHCVYCCLFLGLMSLGFAYIWIIPFLLI